MEQIERLRLLRVCQRGVGERLGLGRALVARGAPRLLQHLLGDAVAARALLVHLRPRRDAGRAFVERYDYRSLLRFVSK